MNFEEKYKLLRQAVLKVGSADLKELAADIEKVQVSPEEQKDTLTKADIMNIFDPVKRQAAIKENRHLFEKSSNSALTKADIMNIFDPIKRQAAIKENMHLFEHGE